MDQRIIALYDDFTHRHLDRRLFLEQASRLVGGTAAALAALSLLQSNRALGQIVAPDDARLTMTSVSFAGSTGAVKAYVARPSGDAKLPCVVVIHENRGLMPHIQDVARRVALAGYVALAPDLMSASGGTPDDEDKARVEFAKVDLAVARKDAIAALAYAKSRPDVNGRTGAVGFCWGGGMVNYLATAVPDLGAGIVYYGRTPPLEDVAKIKTPLLLHYAGLDEPLTTTVPAYEEALKTAGKSYTLYVYPGVNHAFNNDTGAARYDKAAATLAWERSIAFFDKTLKAA